MARRELQNRFEAGEVFGLGDAAALLANFKALDAAERTAVKTLVFYMALNAERRRDGGQAAPDHVGACDVIAAEAAALRGRYADAAAGAA